MRNAKQYPFVSSDSALGEASFRPYLSITLAHQQSSVTILGLLDTGASVNVLPYSTGIELGYIAKKGIVRIDTNLMSKGLKLFTCPNQL